MTLPTHLQAECSDGELEFGRPREAVPSMALIVDAWEALGADEVREPFPNCKALAIGWGEPFCFKCGWLAPVKEAADHPTSWSFARVRSKTWDGAGGWLEKAHLHDHFYGGSMEPLNLVPLCPPCHELQPQCASRQDGIAFVNEPSPYARVMPAVQVVTDAWYRGKSRPGKQRATANLYKAYAAAGAVLEKAKP